VTVTETAAAGTWRLVIETPIGKLRAVLELSTQDGLVRGVVTDDRHDEAIPLTDVVLDGDRLTWAQSIRKPMRLNLTFDVTITGDELTGRAKAGRLASSKVSGHRVTPVTPA
jgi:hypothetical protein